MKPEIARYLWELLWQEYSSRVSYARIYQEMITAAGGTIANDHIALRSLRLHIDSPQGQVKLGIEYLDAIAHFLGYSAQGEYFFPDTHLYARHYRHPQQAEWDLPKLFISELIVEELPQRTQELIKSTVSSFTPTHLPRTDTSTPVEISRQLQPIFKRPWRAPRHSVVEEVNTITQYGAWVLLHGYAVNHFTGYVNHQQTSQYPDIEATVSGLGKLGIPMKEKIEGSETVGLRQTATHAVTEMVTVLDDATGKEKQIPWTYAYYEIAQRYMVKTETGKEELFDGFLGRSAQQLFEMTRMV
ncbi:DUF1338 domain-containing protein [Calothrix rhizosoleniae]|uniref:DUF1338 domain-containing protein n=1 Tax=Calothrix rhizosoleniae TaxID=888997 RepID=UPI000B49EFA3|nr:DUF1338 domain-containing protein [Calothrix rhizosoleniae]